VLKACRSSLAGSALSLSIAVCAALVPVSAAGQTAPDRKTAATPDRASEFFPLRKGAYWLYEVTGPEGRSGYKQVLVTDEVAAGDAPGATDFVLSIIDHSIPKERRPDEPTTIRRAKSGLECLDCGGLFLPGGVENGAAWRGGADAKSPVCRSVDAGMSYRPAGGNEASAIVVSCADPSTGTGITRIYARGFGPVLDTVLTNRDGKGYVRIERLREHRLLDAAAPFPPLPAEPPGSSGRN
jgi:hypothetical protein